MTENGIGDKGLASLSEALKFNTTLTVLYLGRKDKREDIQNAFIKKNALLSMPPVNKIGERGAMPLCEALKSNTTLTKLDLDCFRIDYQSNLVEKLVRTFPTNRLYHL